MKQRTAWIVFGIVLLSAPVSFADQLFCLAGGDCIGHTPGNLINTIDCADPATGICIWKGNGICELSCTNGIAASAGTTTSVNCGRLVMRATGRLAVTLAKCEAKDRVRLMKGGSADPTCLTNARAKYNSLVADLADCPLCLDTESIGNQVETAITGSIGPQSYCQARCGNDVLDPGEGCDDGNILDADGCSSTCTVEP